MPDSKADILAKLKKEILPLSGFKTSLTNSVLNTRLGPIKNAFPNASFPQGAIHEFISNKAEDTAATKGFISVLLASLMHNNGTSIWISSSRMIFPPALVSFGIAPHKIIFISLKKEKEILWTLEEALKCTGLSAVIAETQELSFTTSRRLQLAVEQSQVTGFILRCNPRSINTTVCISRWKISPLSSVLNDDAPGVGFPRWNVELLKVRNGKPSQWQIEFVAGRFRYSTIPDIAIELQKKTG